MIAKTAPGLFEAYDLYANSAESHRWELEARLLAAEPADAIAKKMCLPADAVEWFEALFFNVGDRLQNNSYILRHAIGYQPAPSQVPGEATRPSSSSAHDCHKGAGDGS